MIGDFNEIIGLLKKEGGTYEAKKTNGAVLEVINFCALRDLRFLGPKFTWLYQQRDGF